MDPIDTYDDTVSSLILQASFGWWRYNFLGRQPYSASRLGGQVCQGPVRHGSLSSEAPDLVMAFDVHGLCACLKASGVCCAASPASEGFRALTDACHFPPPSPRTVMQLQLRLQEEHEERWGHLHSRLHGVCDSHFCSLPMLDLAAFSVTAPMVQANVNPTTARQGWKRPAVSMEWPAYDRNLSAASRML